MSTRTLPLFDGFIETPLSSGSRVFCGSPGERGAGMSLWQSQGVAKTMGICDLRDEACRQAGMIGGQRYPVLAVTAPKNDPREAALGNHLLTALGLRTPDAGVNANICSLSCWGIWRRVFGRG